MRVRSASKDSGGNTDARRENGWKDRSLTDSRRALAAADRRCRWSGTQTASCESPNQAPVSEPSGIAECELPVELRLQSVRRVQGLEHDCTQRGTQHIRTSEPRSHDQKNLLTERQQRKLGELQLCSEHTRGSGRMASQMERPGRAAREQARRTRAGEAKAREPGIP